MESEVGAMRLLDLDLIVFDFDGVMTDNAVWIMEDGTEIVRCSRSDGLGLARLRQSGTRLLVLSTEENRVVETRCAKLRIPVIQGVSDKGRALSQLLKSDGINPERVLYLGNDDNDADCLRMVGVPVVVADAHPSVVPLASLVLSRDCGHGAVRELCDLLLAGASDMAGSGD